MKEYMLCWIFMLAEFTVADGQDFTIATSSPMLCEDDDDFERYCSELKRKNFCERQQDVMHMICAKSCNYCPREKFYKGVKEIMKGLKIVAKAIGENENELKKGLRKGKGSPNAGGKFKGQGETDAEKEATEVPENEGAGNKPTSSKESGKELEDSGNGSESQGTLLDGDDGEDKNDKSGNKDNQPKGKGDKSSSKGNQFREQGVQSEGKGDQTKGKGDQSESQGDQSKDKGGAAGGSSSDEKLGGDIGDVGFTTGCDKKCQTECVVAHNKYRANHGAPPLKWDQTLATQAQAVADKNAAANKFEHSDWAAGKGGECIAWGPVKPTWLIAVKDWHDEEKNYDYKTGKSSNGKAIGHFTQVVWKKATKVGCAKSEMTMYGSKGPFYIAQMDVVGIVQGKEELDLVGKPKENDLDWFKGLRDKQMKEAKRKRNFVLRPIMNRKKKVNGQN